MPEEEPLAPIIEPSRWGAEIAAAFVAAQGALRERITEVANRYGRGTTKAAFGADPAFAAEVEDILNGAAA